MLLVVDVGNTNIVLGISQKDTWIYQWRMETIKPDQIMSFEVFLSTQFLENNLDPEQLNGIMYSSVVPDLNAALVPFLRSFAPDGFLQLDPSLISRLSLHISRPAIIGADLVADAYAAREKYGSSIIVDFGTATSFIIVDEQKGILGVTIAPGIRTMVHALSGKTAQLPEVDLLLPDSAIGKDTIHAIQAGVLYGAIGMIRELLHQIQKETGPDYSLIATGGLSGILGDFMQTFNAIDPVLTLDGLRFIHRDFQD